MKFYRQNWLCRLALILFILCSSSEARGQSSPETPEKELFLVAHKAFEDGFYDVAIRYILQLLEEYPQTEKRIQSKLLLGQCYFFKAQYVKAFEIFKELLAFSAFKDATLFWLGETYLKGSDYSQAEKHYRQLIDVYPNSVYVPQAYYSLGWTFFEQKDYKRATEIFLEFLKLFPAHQLAEDARFKTGECAYYLKSYPEAIKYFQGYLVQYPQSTRHDQAYFYMAEAYYYQENFSEAVTYCAKASEISHDNKLVLMSKISMGWSFLKLKQFDQSQKAFDDALSLAADKGVLADDIYLGQATLYSEKKELEKALSSYSHLLSHFPQSPRLAEAYLGKANTLYQLQDYSQAQKTYAELIAKNGGEPNAQEIMEKAYFGLAWSYLKLNDIDASIQSFQEIINKTKSNVVKISAYSQIGDAYQDVGNLEKAIETYDKILKEFPSNPYSDYIQYRQGVAFLKMDKLQAAQLAFQALKANYPNSKYLKDSRYYLGVAYFKDSNWTAAKVHIEDFLTDVPSTNPLIAEAHYILALSIFNLEDPSTAMKIFQKIIKDYPGDETIVKNAEVWTAKCLYQLGNAKEALKKFKIIIYKYSRSEVAKESLLWLGHYYLENSDFANAIQYYEQLLAEFPRHEQLNAVHYALGEAYRGKGALDKALNQYKLINDPADKELYAKAKLAIADIFSTDLDPPTAISKYQDIVDSCPDFKRNAYLKIAQVYLRNKDYEQAIAAYQSALKSDLGLSTLKNGELQFYIADTYESLNNSPKAIEEYLKIPYLYPEESTWIIKAYLRMARIFENKEDWSTAQMIYRKIIEFETAEAKFAEERLQWIKDNIPLMQ